MTQTDSRAPQDEGVELCERTESSNQADRDRPRLRIRVPDSSGSLPKETAADASDPSTSRKANAPDLHNVFGHATAVKFTSVSKRSCSKFAKLKDLLPRPNTAWITDNLEASRIKATIRSSVAAWISILLLVIMATERLMGQASFVILIAAFMSPPAEPFIAVLEREVAILLFTSISFAWTCLGIRLADLARKNHDTSATVNDIFSGDFIEAWPTIICAIFLFVGTSTLLYMRARIGPGPYIRPIVLSCIVLDISLTVAPLYPYPFYNSGRNVVIPIAFHSAVAMVCSVFVFPETVNAQFIKRFRGLFVPLAKAMRTQSDIFATSAMSDDFSPEPFFKQITAAEAALAPLAATSRLLKKDLSWSRFGSKDFSRLHELARRMTVRANGMAFYFKIIDPVAAKQPGTPAFSLMNTPLTSPAPSRPATRPPSPSLPSSPTPSQSEANSPSNASIASSTRRRNRHRDHSAQHSLYQHTLNFYHTHHHAPHHHLHLHSHHRHASSIFTHPSALFHEVLGRGAENAVGVFESQRYLNLESRLAHPRADALIPEIMGLLSESARELLACCADTLDHLTGWLARMSQDRFWQNFYREREMTWAEGIRSDEAARDRLRKVLDEFRTKKRHRVLDMYRPYVDPDNVGSALEADEHSDPPPHRYLFQCYLYQYHLIFFSEYLCQLLEEIIDLEKTRPRSRLWLPVLPLKKILVWSKWEPTDSGLQQGEDEDPNIIQGIDPENQNLLGEPTVRDPDALPPGNTFEAIGNMFHHSISALGHGNAVFGFKAGILSVLLSLPSFIPSSAHFAFVNRSVWAVVIGQLTISRFRGDTAFGLLSRVLATFLGGLVGTVMWYMSTGLGDGNSYGLAAVCAVCFPPLFFIRLYYPASPITLTIFTVTVGLVVGYSWQDTHIPTLSNEGKGVQVAWIRFTLVTIGVTVAFIFSFLPPSTTLRRYLRTTYATTAQQLGQGYCDVVSHAGVQNGSAADHHQNQNSPQTSAIIKDLIAIRLKLRRARALTANVQYEFSLRGKWPRERYNTVHEIQVEIAYLLSHLRSVTEHLEPAWARAFLRRTRFLEPDFQGDVLAVISMVSTALRTGTPLPQVTPCPLLDRFVAHAPELHGLRGEEDDDGGGGGGDDYGLPRTLAADTLEDEQFLYFSVGVATAFGIVTRLDRLMMATKELVGEQFHIQGLPVYFTKTKSTQ